MSGPSSAALLEELLASGATCIGEVAIAREADGAFKVTHRDDVARGDLQLFKSANQVVRYDDAGKYRPLKTAPNLRHGWKLLARDADELARSVEEIYPGRLAALRASRANELRTTTLRDALARQSGMYRIAARITDAQLDELVGNFCRSDGGCLRTIVWRRNAADTVPSSLLPDTKYDPRYDQTGRCESAIPLLCQEACNLLVAAAREVVKREE